LMRNGRDRRSGNPVKCHARKERALLVGTRSANHIRASGHSGCTQRPDTWLHPNASRKRQIGAPRIDGELQARHRDQSNHSWALDAVASQDPLPDLAELPAQPPVRACGDRHVCGCHRDVPAPLDLDCAQPRPQTGCSFRGHPKSHAKLALAPDDRGLSLGHCTALSATGPGQIVWSGLPPSPSRDGNHGGHHCPAITLAEPLRRASHRFDPP
jgi:hypothetical protein